MSFLDKVRNTVKKVAKPVTKPIQKVVNASPIVEKVIRSASAVSVGIGTAGLVKPKFVGIKSDQGEKIFRVSGTAAKVVVVGAATGPAGLGFWGTAAPAGAASTTAAGGGFGVKSVLAAFGLKSAVGATNGTALPNGPGVANQIDTMAPDNGFPNLRTAGLVLSGLVNRGSESVPRNAAARSEVADPSAGPQGRGLPPWVFPVGVGVLVLGVLAMMKGRG